jgi:hypothetical protein
MFGEGAYGALAPKTVSLEASELLVHIGVRMALNESRLVTSVVTFVAVKFPE